MSMFYELMMRKKEEIMYATIKGTLTENDGVFSGWNLSNYLEVQNLLTFGKNNFELKVCITPTSTNSSRIFASGDDSNSFTGIYVRNSNFAGSFYDGTTRTIIDTTISYNANTTYYAILYRSGTKIGIKVSTDDVNYTDFSQTISLSTEIIANSKFIFGKDSYNSTYIVGSIDLNNSYIKLGSTKYKLQAVVGYTVVGSPTITDGVVSGFSASDYLRTSKLPILSEDFEMQFKIRINDTSTSNALLGWVSGGYANYFSFSTSGKIQISFRVSSSVYYNINGNFVFSTNTDYWVKYSKKGNAFYLHYSTDGVNWFLDNSATFEEIISFSVSNYFRIGVNGFNNPSSYFNGSIDLNETYIKINNKLWFNGQQA